MIHARPLFLTLLSLLATASLSSRSAAEQAPAEPPATNATCAQRIGGVRSSIILDISVPSACLERTNKALVILPESYDGRETYPTLYLLHGHDMPYTDWLRLRPDLAQLATAHGMIIVCPDGANSWYIDSPEDPTSRYETFIAQNLVPFIDHHFRTRPEKTARAITGLSMGGHGALWLAIRHQDTFGACGAMSGAVNLSPFPNRWGLQKLLGDASEHADRLAQYSVSNQLEHIRPGLALLIDCGSEDFFYEVNTQLHQALLERRIPHDFISRPGAHNGAYWRNALLYQLLYFAEYFRTHAAP